MLISIIIPVYNVEKYLEKCLDSIINQTYKELEIIVINDGSTDNSLKICRRYEELDNRIVVIDKTNGGLMSAWKLGVKFSKGQYISFVDSDDWVDLDYIEKYVKKINVKNYDVIINNHIEEYNNESIKILGKCDVGEYTKSQIDLSILPKLINDGSYFGRILYLCRWGKIIRADLLKNNLIYCNENISYGEDINIMVPVILDSKLILIQQNFSYHYRQNDNSIMNTYKKRMNEQIIDLHYALKLIVEAKGRVDMEQQIYNNYICMKMAVIRNEINSLNIKREIINKVFMDIKDPELKKALKINSLKELSITNKIILFAIKLNNKVFYYLLYYYFKIIGRKI